MNPKIEQVARASAEMSEWNDDEWTFWIFEVFLFAQGFFFI